MPDVRLDVPVGQFGDNDVAEEAFLLRIREIVAEEMSCKTDKGEALILDPDTQIDLFPTYYGPNAHVNGKVFVLVSAFDYVDRMANMPRRVANIKAALAALLCLDLSEVSVRFAPCPEANWV